MLHTSRFCFFGRNREGRVGFEGEGDISEASVCKNY